MIIVKFQRPEVTVALVAANFLSVYWASLRTSPRLGSVSDQEDKGVLWESIMLKLSITCSIQLNGQTKSMPFKSEVIA